MKCMRGNFIFNEDQSACISPIEDCVTDKNNYPISDGRFWCDQCPKGLHWKWLDDDETDEDTTIWGACVDCQTIMPNCRECESPEVCHTCEDGFHLNPDSESCAPDFENCADGLSPWDHLEDEGNNRYTCKKCSKGFAWNDEEFECTSCDEIDEKCLECNRDGECTECDGGKMPQVDGSSCIPRFDHCAEEDYDSQPGQLSSTDSEWYCGDCERGWFWDDVSCAECQMDLCTDCEGLSNCLECEAGFMPEFDGSYCRELIEHCLV